MSDINRKTESAKDEDIELSALVRYLAEACRRFALLLCALVLIFAVAGNIFERVTYTDTHSATATFALNPAQLEAIDNGSGTKHTPYSSITAEQLADSFVSTVNSSFFADLAAEQLGKDELDATIKATRVGEESNYITVSVKSSSDKELPERVLSVISPIYTRIMENTVGAVSVEGFSSGSESSAAPSVIFLTVKYTVFAVLLWGMLVLIYSMTRDRILSKDDVSEKLGRTCFATLPHTGRRADARQGGIDILLKGTNPIFAESIKLLASKTARGTDSEKGKLITLTSASKGEGKSTVAVNLAAALSMKGCSVLLIDGDLRTQNLKEMLGIVRPTKGLVDIVEGAVKRSEFIYSDDKLPFSLICGDRTTSSTARVIRSKRIRSMLDMLRGQYDIILIDAPASADYSDAAALSGYADEVYFIIREDTEDVKRIILGIDSVESAGIQIKGYILNCSSSELGGVYGYGKKYGYGKYGYGKYGYGKYGYGKRKSTDSENTDF